MEKIILRARSFYRKNIKMIRFVVSISNILWVLGVSDDADDVVQ